MQILINKITDLIDQLYKKQQEQFYKEITTQIYYLLYNFMKVGKLST